MVAPSCARSVAVELAVHSTRLVHKDEDVTVTSAVGTTNRSEAMAAWLAATRQLMATLPDDCSRFRSKTKTHCQYGSTTIFCC